ncbi:MAG: molybdopterin-dependent oxidoreductase [Proteobacteria bacterium]|nr:molybdopterin-dependent oxidoreductase [Pseudomonadota bacterium]MCP4917472.1 molybdopterin-dependent oxidoreductase [Pseudomonadota bacterium]
MSTSLARTQGGPIRGATGVAGAVPFGSPSRLVALAQAVSENRHALGLARTVLREGVCDACAIGSQGMYDEVGLHLCPDRLRRLSEHTRGHLVPADLLDIERLRGMDRVALEALGRIPYPFLWRRGERGLDRVSWDEALSAVRETWGPSSWRARGGSREELGAIVRAARSVTTDLSLLPSTHAAWRRAMSETLGTTRATARARDVVSSDLVLVWGSNLAVSNPTVAGWLAQAKTRGARVVVVNAVVEPGLERTWGLSPFGHRVADDVICVRPGADAALTNAVLQRLIDWDAVAELDATTTGLPELGSTECGVPARDVDWLATLIARAGSMVSIFGSGISRDEAAVRGLVNLHLARDAVARDGCGIIPLTGAPRDALDLHEALGSARMRATWGPASEAPGGDLHVVFAAKSPGPSRVRVVVDTHLTPWALRGVDELLVVLPASGRHEQAGTFTSALGLRRGSPELIPALAESRPAGDISALLVGQADPLDLDIAVPAIPGRPCADGAYALPRGLAVLSTVDAPVAEGFVVTAKKGIPAGLVHVGHADAARLGLSESTHVHVVTELGRQPCSLRIGELPAGVVQVGRMHARALLGAARWAEVRVEVA